MHLDLQTISVVTVFIAALLGAFLVFAGLQSRAVRAPIWWGSAHIVNACGFALLTARDSAPEFVTICIANALVLFGYGLTWTGARIFDGRPIRPSVVLVAPLIWIALCRIPAFAADPGARIIVASTMLAALALLAAREFWLGRAEPLMSRWPLVVVFFVHGVTLLLRVPAVLFSPSFRDQFALSSLSFTLLAFATLLFTVIIAFLQLNLTKERSELRHKINSLVDPLSGVANRRAFLEQASSLLGRHGAEHEPLAVLLFDLDHFKQINDRFGHASGDAVLQVFADTATATLGADVLFARIGGEEFASCLRVGDIDEAYAIAERVRRNFVAAAAHFGREQFLPSVSVGITLGRESGLDVGTLLSVADRALYRAKELGRNRVEIEMQDGEAASAPSIVPIIGSERTAPGAHSSGRRWRAAL
ncbi:MAG: GGDEF domain-containing protein [Xanthobacteraceae bacterium]